MFSPASEVPAPVLAELIGIADKTAVKWAALAGRDWSEYVTQRHDQPRLGNSRDRDSAGQPHTLDL